MRYSIWLLAGVLILAPMEQATALEPQSQTPARRPVSSADDLPRYSYPIQGQATTLLTDEGEFATLAATVRANVETTLALYDVTDRPTLRGLHGTLRDIALIEGNIAVARAQIDIIRNLEDKEAERLQSGLLMSAYLDGLEAGPVSSPAFRARFRERYAAMLAPLPPAIIRDDVQERTGLLEVLTPAILIGQIDQTVQPAVASGGAVSGDIIAGLIGAIVTQRIVLPLKDDIVEIQRAYLGAQMTSQADIWMDRVGTLPTDAALTPVVMAVWDGGVDVSVFGNALWVNPAERANGLDDDANGFVDDVHGIGYDEERARRASLLREVPDSIAPRLDRTRDLMQGMNDIQAGIRSAASASLMAQAATATPAEVQQAFTDLDFYGAYGHGTHVGGIMLDGNPAARLLVIRTDYGWVSPPRRPTLERSTRRAEVYREIIDYLRSAGARVVNLSWSFDLKNGYEGALEANGVPPGEREIEARRLFDIDSAGLREAIAAAPDILFVVSAGNSNDSAEFAGSMPASIEADNVLTVAAVDQAGEPTNFTSGGPTVDLAANGYKIDSVLPGGTRQAWSGTSMASPQVANLAGKLLAMKPALTVAQLRALLIESATETPAGYRLIHPAAALQALTQ